VSQRADVRLGPRLAAVVVYGAAMGWLEAVVVAYIRSLLGMPRGPATPPPAAMVRAFAAHPWLLPTEQTREAATLVMLAAVAWLAARRAGERLGAFMVAFGVWDITYYVALRRLWGWPPSLGTRDLLFLIPLHPWWIQPVWVPIAISCAMIAGGVALMRRGR
jgi:hypothetical protein